MFQKSLNSGFHNLFHLHFRLDKEILEVSLFQFFANLGRNVIMLALPFYLYRELGYELWQICLFFLCWQGASTLVVPFAGVFLSRFGLKHSMLMRSVGVAVFWVALALIMTGNLGHDVLFLIPFFLLRSFSKGVSEIAYDIFLTHHMNRGSGGRTLAGMQIAIMLAVVLAPIAGGFAMREFGFQWVAYTAAFFYLLSGSTLLLTPDEKFKVPYTPSKLLKDSFKNTEKELIIGEFGRVFFDAVTWIVWPVFLLMIFTNVVSIGAVVGLSSAFAMFVTFFIGKKIDKLGISKRSLRFGAYRSILLNFIRGIVWDPVVLIIIDSLHKINLGTTKVPYTVQIYKWLHKQDTYERAHIRWMVAENTYTVAVAIFTLLFFLFAQNIRLVFVLIFALGSLTMLCTQAVAKFED